MDLGLNGKVALVTGASRGLGRASALALAAEGAKVVMNARDPERLEEAAEGIRNETGTEVHAAAGDVRDPALATRLVETAVREFGGLDVLVANAGGPKAGTFASVELEWYQDAVELNLLSTVYLVHAAVPEMRKRDWGRIITITSVSAKQPIPGLLLSNVVRPAITGFLKTVSQELAAEGITVNAVAPGYISTDRVEELLDEKALLEGVPREELRARWAADIPMGRMGQPTELGAVIAFLASEPASYLTGHTLQMDGGFVRGLL